MRDVAHVGFLGLNEVVLGSIKRRKVIIERIFARACANDRSVVMICERVTTLLSEKLQFSKSGGGAAEMRMASRTRDVTHQSLNHFILHHSV